MHSPKSSTSDPDPHSHATEETEETDDIQRIERHENRNLLVLAIHQIVFRMGWIFKTESVIIPAFLDHVAGAGWIRGCLPVLNRLGQSTPPVFLAEPLKSMRRKKWALAAFTLLMSLPFAALSAIWFAARGATGYRMAGLFLLLYFTFFVFNGLYHLSFGTVQGKLIRPTRRGYLLWVSTFWGAIPATVAALWLMPRWMKNPYPGWGYVFAFVATCFFVSGLLLLWLREPSDPRQDPHQTTRGSISETLHTLRKDGNLQRLILVAMFFGSGLIIFPHYQAMANERLGLSGVDLVVWVVTQNIAVALFSLIVGPLADRRGNRLTLRILVFGSAIPPAIAILMVHLPESVGKRLFWLVFVSLGITPLVLRTLLNYALEICPTEKHPRYLSIVNLGLATPFLLSPAVGWLVDATSFELVFLGTSALVFGSGLLTFQLDEPRYRITPEQIPHVDVDIGDV